MGGRRDRVCDHVWGCGATCGGLGLGPANWVCRVVRATCVRRWVHSVLKHLESYDGVAKAFHVSVPRSFDVHVLLLDDSVHVRSQKTKDHAKDATVSNRQQPFKQVARAPPAYTP